ncbi:MAG: DUF2892 domain-containing protein [Azoarcus sp.]|jgi:hypothetical protein|nr:DUF2892 domain-containing protein [Azoarcus sp.]
MKINVGCSDRALRAVVGLVLVALAATGIVTWWGWLGVLPLLSAVFRFCPAYSLLGINTAKGGCASGNCLIGKKS